MPSKFVHLHVHSHYSLLEALPKVKALVKQAKAQGMDAFALTDNGVMYGAVEFYQKATDEGLKPIIGMDAYMAPYGRLEKRPKIDNKPFRLVLLAETNEGYKSLMKISTIGFMEGFYYKPRIDKDVLRQFCEGKDHGIIALSGSHYGEIPTLIRNGEVDKAEAVAAEYAKIFGADHFYLELVDRPEMADARAVNAVLIEIGHKLNIPLVVTKDTFYLKPTDAEAWKILACVKGGKTLEEYERLQAVDFDASFCDGEQIEKRFEDVPEAIENTRKIADRCNVTMELGKWNFANIEIPEGRTAQEWLRERALAELPSKVPEVTEEMLTRIDYELGVIQHKGFAPYFLIVSDYIEWARKNGIMTTTRGSAAGSLVGFSIGISTVNPIVYKLPFERFLNPERPSAPDVDGDFADNRREEVYNYVRDKYGADKVAQICTFGTMMARGSVRDVGRALGFPHSDCDRIAKMVPPGSQGFPMSLKRAIEENPDLGKLYKSNAQVKRLIDLAMQIEGCGRHVSIHAAGVVISPLPLTEFTPLQIETREGRILTQYEMHTVEAAGVLKMDFLGIRNLSILGDAVALVKKLKQVSIIPEQIPIDDPQTFKLLAEGQTMGVFQLGGSGMTKYLMDLKPQRVEDIMAMVALYRPGPMESIPEYIQRKHHPELVSYLDPRMEEILDQSYGIITYQDDVMLLAIKLAGYSWLEADKLRKAMGKKIPEEMAAQKEKLLEGFVKKGGLPKTMATQLWKLIEPFAAYGFNKCLTGDTRVMDPRDGSYATIEELFRRGKGGKIVTMQNNLQLCPQQRSPVVQNGIKPVFEILTRSGRRIRASANHPFRRFDGWTRLDALCEGERIAVPRRLPSGPGFAIDNNKLRVLGYLIAEGNLCHPHGVYYYAKNPNEVADFCRSVKAGFANCQLTLDKTKPTVAVYVGQENKRQGNALFMWLRSLGLIGKTAVEKSLPDFVYQLNEQQLAELIAGMWQGDGCIHPDRFGQIFYATSSVQLVRQLQHLLLRLGIISTIHTKRFAYRGGHRIGYTLNISHLENIKRFAETIGKRLLSHKQKPLREIIRTVELAYKKTGGVIARGTKDIIPSEVLAIIREEMRASGMTVAQVVAKTHLAERLFHVDVRRIGYTRPTIQRLAQCLNSSRLRDLAVSDVYWDEVVSITASGKEMTYDLEVPRSHNFVANDFIVHNSHAASYGMVAYQTAYMKANYPAIYMTALMTAESADLEKIAEAVAECERMGIHVLSPDINESRSNFTYIDDTHIRFGLLAIKNLGEDVIQHMFAEREANGPFVDLADFGKRVHHRAFNRKSIEALIKAGALDRFGERRQMLENLDQILLYNKACQQQREQNQGSLFDLAPSLVDEKLRLKPVAPASAFEKLAWEKELLGLYVSAHPTEEIFRLAGDTVKHLAPALLLPDKTFVYLCVAVNTIKTILTKKQEHMAFVMVGDSSGSAEVIAFPRTYLPNKELLVDGAVLLVSAQVSTKDGVTKFIGSSFIPINEKNSAELAGMLRQGMWIPESVAESLSSSSSDRPRYPETSYPESRPPATHSTTQAPRHSPMIEIQLRGKPSSDMIADLREVFASHPGTGRICLVVESAGTMRRIETEYSMQVEAMDAVKGIVGAENVRLA